MEAVPAIFLVVDGARSQALTRVWERFDDAAVAQVELYFRPATDVALVAVTLGPEADRGRWIGRVVASGVAVIDPARMNAGDRRAFFATYLASYERIASGCGGVAEAMTALRARAANPRNARGTGPAHAVSSTATPSSSMSIPQLATPPPPPPSVANRTLAFGVAASAGGPPLEREPPPLPPVPRAGGDKPTLMGMGVQVPEPHVVSVRFLRGGHWAPARLRSLSARGAYLVTGAPPRIGDSVHVALDLDERSALVRGTVYHVTTPRDATTTGSSGFAVRFAAEASPARARLLELLQTARTRKVVIKPPPPRASMRFPVRWPVELHGTHPSHVDALDVSQGGLFVGAPHLDLGATLSVTLPIDAGDAPLALTARVARVVTTSLAAARGLSPGAGLAITAFADGDGVRWLRFLTRVERRTTRTVLVGAALPRLEAITRALADAGYAVAPCTDPGTLIRLADAGTLPDACVIDTSLLDQGVSATWLEQMFTARQVPCITVRGEAHRARLVVDRLLAVSH